MILAIATALVASGPRLGPEVLVSDQSDGGGLRCEPSVAVSKDNVLVSWNDSYGGKHGSPSGTALGWAISYDRGATYRFGGYLGRSKDDATQVGSDSRIVAAADGTFRLMNLRWAVKSMEMQVYRLDPRSDKGMELIAVPDSSSGDPDIDKPAMAIEGNDMAIAYTRGRSIALVVSHDLGSTWTKPEIISETSSKVRTNVGVCISGGKILASWMEGKPTGTDEVWIGGPGRRPQLALRLQGPAPSPKGFRIGPGAFTLTSCDVSVLPGWRLVFTDGYHIATSSSADGHKWSSATSVSGDLKEAWFPSASGPSPAAVFYGRGDPENGLTDAYFSTLGGEPPLRLSSVSTDWLKTPADNEHAMIQRNFGDYISLAGDDRGWIAVWTDGRTGQPRIFSRRIDLR